MLWHGDWLDATLAWVSDCFGVVSNCVCVRPTVLKCNDNFTFFFFFFFFFLFFFFLLLLLLHVHKK
jgi:hypothetical protein